MQEARSCRTRMGLGQIQAVQSSTTRLRTLISQIICYSVRSVGTAHSIFIFDFGLGRTTENDFEVIYSSQIFIPLLILTIVAISRLTSMNSQPISTWKCKSCPTEVASSEHLTSRLFIGRHGRAHLFSEVFVPDNQYPINYFPSVLSYCEKSICNL